MFKKKIINISRKGTITNMETLLEFAKLGVYIQYDLFGLDGSSLLLLHPVKFLSDSERVESILQLVNEGLTNQLLMSTDIHSRHRLV